jgi:hypothetical protein
MTTTLRAIGYWDGVEEPDGWPDVCAFVSTMDNTVDRAQDGATVAAYLRSGTVYAVAGGWSVCRLCGAANGNAERTDGRFLWPEGLAHYVEAHAVRLPDEFVAVAARGRAPAVDVRRAPDGFDVDVEWWRGQPGTRHGGHLRGCRHSPLVAGWDLPTRAAIHVDGVPRDAVATMVALRRLLGTTWRFSELRDLIGAQPFHAVTGDAAALHRELTTSPELRPYLFYDDGGSLRPVWSGD